MSISIHDQHHGHHNPYLTLNTVGLAVSGYKVSCTSLVLDPKQIGMLYSSEVPIVYGYSGPLWLCEDMFL